MEPARGEHTPHASPPSLWPVGFAVGIAVLLTGVILGWVVAALGALLTLADAPWYAVHAATAPAWGMTPLEDQQLAGLIMWLGVNAFYFMLITIVFLTWATREEAKDGTESLPGRRPAPDTPGSSPT